jgi:hypothetical protein
MIFFASAGVVEVGLSSKLKRNVSPEQFYLNLEP